MLLVTKPWLVQADLIEMVKKKPLDFEAAFEALINDPESIHDEEAEMTAQELLEHLKAHDLEFADIYRTYYDELKEHSVCEYVDITAKGTVIKLSWKNPHEGDQEKG